MWFGWSWFSDPRGIALGAETVVGLAGSDGGWYVARHSAGRAPELTLLQAGAGANDHNAPALLRDNDGTVLAFCSAHNGAAYFVQRSRSPDDVSAWEGPADIAAQLGGAGFCYASPVQLGDAIHLFYRARDGGGNWGPHVSVSTDGGRLWSRGVHLIAGRRPYLKAVRNGPDRIDFACTDGHPASLAACSVYHFFFGGGGYYDSRGNRLALPIVPSQMLPPVWDGSGAGGKGWIWDIAIDPAGHPVIAYAVFPDPRDHRYRLARWTGAGWDDTEVCTAGTHLCPGEIYYSGGIAIDPADSRTLYASRDTGDGIHQLWKLTEPEAPQASWQAEQITFGTDLAIRPAVIRGRDRSRLAFMAGPSYDHYTRFRTQIVVCDAP